jgi:glycosyltransferase involved in cell wall biosynthesis
MIKLLQVVPSDTKNDLLMDLLSTNILQKESNFVVMLTGGTGELSKFCESQLIPYVILRNRNRFLQLLLIYRHVRRIKPDRIFFQSFFPSFIGAMITFFPRDEGTRIYSVRHHNMNHHILKNRKAIFVDRFISKRVDFIFAVSDTVRKTLLKEGCDDHKIIVVENGLDVSRYRFASPELRIYTPNQRLELIAVGRLDWQKNYDLMFRVVHRLKIKGIPFALTIYGDGPVEEFSRLNELIVKLELADFVQWGGWIPNIEIAFNKAHLLLHTAADEACPLVLIEAQLAGVPIVSTVNGGSADVIRGHFGAVAKDDENLILSRILEVISEYQSHSRKSIEISFAAKNRFNPEVMALPYVN